MSTYEAPTYGERIADVYDNYPTTPGNADQAVEVLAALAGKRRVLELGIGTGRIALPLAARGFKVSGIDASPKMVEKMREKPGGDAIQVTIGNFADVKVPGQFSLIYVAFNTFFALLSQEEQLRCFGGVARHLTDDGAFVMEAFVPDITRFDRGQRTSTIHLDTEHAYIDSAIHDPVNQRVRAAHIILGEDGTRFYPLELRYAWPAELDLMARLAGMRLRERWGGWNREPFAASSERHVSIYEKVLPLPSIPAPRKPPAGKTARRKRA
ncbi:MAG: class I SAM-dependent DNA methyltransferase [Candidatus Binataceae bacterium]